MSTWGEVGRLWFLSFFFDHMAFRILVPLQQKVKGVQWLGLCNFIAEGPSSISDGGTEITKAVRWRQKEKDS